MYLTHLIGVGLTVCVCVCVCVCVWCGRSELESLSNRRCSGASLLHPNAKPYPHTSIASLNPEARHLGKRRV